MELNTGGLRTSRGETYEPLTGYEVSQMVMARWRELKTLMLNDLEDINQERISYKYNLQSQKNMLRNPRCTVLPSTFL